MKCNYAFACTVKSKSLIDYRVIHSKSKSALKSISNKPVKYAIPPIQSKFLPFNTVRFILQCKLRENFDPVTPGEAVEILNLAILTPNPGLSCTASFSQSL